MTPKQILSAKVIVVCGIAIILILIVNFLSSPSSEAKFCSSLESGFFALTERGEPSPSSPSTPRSFDDLLDAIEWVESRGDANAVGHNGRAIGAYQIQKIYVDDINRIVELCGEKAFSFYWHRWDRDISRLMVDIYISYYATRKRIGREPTFEDMARIHNGGPDGWRKESTKPYWQKVKKRLVGAAATDGYRSFKKEK